jgi:DUF4097 and DUF4098 domain-containing protein YvlB
MSTMPTFATPEPISISLELSVGDVRIAASERTETVVDVRPSDPAKRGDVAAAEQTRVECASGRLLVKAPKSWRQWTPKGGGESIDVEIQVPTGSHLTGEAGVAAVHTRGRLGEVSFRAGVGDIDIDEAGLLRVRTGAGDVTVGRAGADVEVKTGSGRIDVHVAAGRAVVKNSNGDTHLGDVGGDLRVQSANGKISVDQARSSVVAKTAFGDIHFGAVAHGSVEAHTAYGQIDIAVVAGVVAWLDLHTGFGGVHSDLDVAEPPRPGEETVEIRAATAMGDILVRRTPAVMTSGADG